MTTTLYYQEDNMHLRKHPRLDYNQLNESIFPDEIGVKQLPSGETTYAVYDASFGGDKPKTLQEAKEIPEGLNGNQQSSPNLINLPKWGLGSLSNIWKKLYLLLINGYFGKNITE